MSDVKAGLTSTRKPLLSLIPRFAKVYLARALGYGRDKYFESNFYGAAPPGITPAARLLGYLSASERHISRVTDALNRAIGTGGDVVAAARIVDDDGDGDFPPSMLPDLAGALASLAIGILCAVQDGLLAEDPGQPWEKHPDYPAAMARRGKPINNDAIPQKLAPTAEALRTVRVSGDVGRLMEAGEPQPWQQLNIDYSRPTLCAAPPWQGTAFTTMVIRGVAADLCPGESDLAADSVTVDPEALPLPPIPEVYRTTPELRLPSEVFESTSLVDSDGTCAKHGQRYCRECQP